jgi:hypothetical protein
MNRYLNRQKMYPSLHGERLILVLAKVVLPVDNYHIDEGTYRLDYFI